MWPHTVKLTELLERTAAGAVPRGWLYLPQDWRTWNAETSAYMIDIEDQEHYDSVQIEAKDRGYSCTIDEQTLEDVIRAAHECLGVDSFAGRLEALIYYYRFDAFLPQIGAPDPPPWEETRARLDREFYDSLGAERSEVPCRSPGCARGAVKLSALCKVHHFEQVRGRTCPFHD